MKDGKYIPVQDVADRLRELSSQLAECSELRLKEQLMDALLTGIATRLNMEVSVEKSSLSFEKMVRKAVKIEQSYLAEQSIDKARLRGLTISNLTALSASAKPVNAARATLAEVAKVASTRHVREPNSAQSLSRGRERTRNNAFNNANRDKDRSHAYSYNAPNPKIIEPRKEKLVKGMTKRELREKSLCFECGEPFRDCPHRKGTQTYKSVATARFEEPAVLIDLDSSSSFEDEEAVTTKINPAAEAISNPCTSPGVSAASSPAKEPSSLVATFIASAVRVNSIEMEGWWDSLSSDSFISPTAAKAAKCRIQRYDVPIPIKLMAKGSRSSVKHFCYVLFQYQGIDAWRRLEICNLDGRDLLLGSDIMHDYSVQLNFNPPKVEVLQPKGNGRNVQSSAVSRDILSEVEPANDAERDQLQQQFLKDYADLFRTEEDPLILPPQRAILHMIPLKDENLVIKPKTYGIAEKHRAAFKRVYDRHVQAGIWVPKRVASASPLHVIGKKDKDDVRCTVDSRERNKNTVAMISPLPDQRIIVNHVARSKYVSCFDGQGMFQQIRVRDEDVLKTAFTTPFGTCVSLVAQQGDLNSPNTCQTWVNETFSEYLGNWLHAYIDDFFICSDTFEEHKDHLRLFLDRCRADSLFLSKKKAKFLPAAFSCLGRHIDRGTISIEESKISAIQNFAEPADKKGVRRFWGLVNYHAAHIPELTEYSAPLYDLADHAPFRWSAICQAAFDKLKELVSNNVGLSVIDDSTLSSASIEPFHSPTPIVSS